MSTKITDNFVSKIFEKEFRGSNMRPCKFKWWKKDGFETVYCDFGNKNYNQDEAIHINVNNRVTGQYFIPDKKHECVWIRQTYLCDHTSRNNIRNNDVYWQHSPNYGNVYCIDKNKNITLYSKNYNQITTCKVKRLPSVICNIQESAYVRKILEDMFGELNIRTRMISDSDLRGNTWMLQDFFTLKGRKISDKNRQLLNDKMAIFGSMPKHIDQKQRLFVLDTTNNNLLIRFYDQGFECGRKFIDDKTKKPKFVFWKNNEWVPSNTGYLYGFKYEMNPDCLNDQKYKYLHKYVVEYQKYIESMQSRYSSPDYYTYMFINNLVFNPAIEKVLAVGNKDLKNAIYNQYGDIDRIFGKINYTKTSLFTQLGVNKYQFEHQSFTHNSDTYVGNNPIMFMKEFLKSDDISHIDQETWDQIIALPITIYYRHRYTFNRILEEIDFSIRDLIKFLHIADQYTTITQSPYNYNYYRNEYIEIYKDYIKMYRDVQRLQPDIQYPIFVKSFDLLTRYHDELSHIVNEAQEKIDEAKWATIREAGAKYYTETDEYIIRYPNSASELKREGNLQHICIGGYTHSVEQGNTNIFLIRKKSEVDKPFFAMEVNPKKVLVQLHGYYNAWLGSNPECTQLIPVLIKFFNKHKITYDKKVLTCKSVSYGSYNAEYVDWDPQWDNIK